jgi:uncharacterized protein YjbI with pentapeptide repeats
MSRASFVIALSALLSPITAIRADIFQWEYIDPADPSRGKRVSATLAQGGAGVDAVPGAVLSFRNLTMAYLIGADLSNANFYLSTLANADFTGAKVRGTVFSTDKFHQGAGITLAHLYSTASYQAHDLSGVDLGGNNLVRGDFSGQNLTNAKFVGADLTGANLREANLSIALLWGATLTDADFAGADVRGAYLDNRLYFAQGNGLTLAQLYSTASYQAQDLSGIRLTYHNLAGANFVGQNLIDVDFTEANLREADFTAAVIRAAKFGTSPFNGGTGISLTQIYSTASYQLHDLSGIDLQQNQLVGGNFAGQNLTNANFAGADMIDANFREANLSHAAFGNTTLTGADFTDADVRGAGFSGAMYKGFTLGQLYSTASYQAHHLAGIDLSQNNLSGGNFAGQNLANANFSYADLTGADLRDADLTGASLGQAYLTGADITGADVQGANLRRTLRFPDFPTFTLAQLYSTASYQARQLTGIDLSDNDLSGANFAGQNLAHANFYLTTLSDVDFSEANLTNANLLLAELTGADFRDANLTNAVLAQAALTDADFTNADVRGANFGATMHLGFTLAQLYSTASYQAGDLSGIYFGYNTVAGANFVGQDLANADFFNAELTDGDFRDANLADARFGQARLTGADFRQANLTNAGLNGATVTDADFTGAEVRGASFNAIEFCDSFWGCYTVGSGVTLTQLYSTASYQAGDLSGINFGLNDLAGAEFAGQNLTNANFSEAHLAGADFSAADVRGAFLDSIAAGAITTNLIRPDGHIGGVHLAAGGLLIIRDYDGDSTGTNPIDGSPAPLPPIPISIDQHLTMGPGGTLRIVFESDAWNSTISFAPGTPVTLGGALELTFAADVNLPSQVGRTFDLFDWTGVSPAGAFAISSPYAWDFSNLYTSGEVTLTAIPEPGSVALAILVAAHLLINRRSGRTNLPMTQAFSQ